jgi:hypothetical protein
MLRERGCPAQRVAAYRGRMREGATEDPFAEDPDDDDPDAPPIWFAGQHLPPDARRIGLSTHVYEGAILDFAGRLDSTKPGHRLTAWVLLAVFGLPVLLSVLRLVAAL